MKPETRTHLIGLAREYIATGDVSHDVNHALRVLANAEHIATVEGGDLDIIIPAALFHDLVVYPKNDPRSDKSAVHSAMYARPLLFYVDDYPQQKIIRVQQAIVDHSYGNGIRPSMLESKIVQDADRLEATGAITIMRVFASTGQMKREFYSREDPFCETRKPDPRTYALDLFYERLLKVEERMNTNTGREMAKDRTQFLYQFLEQLKSELHDDLT
jgi:uncharacterized protein